jgi:hypothetical protein
LSHRGHDGVHRHESADDSGLWRPGWRLKVTGFAVGGLLALLSFGSPNGYSRWGSVLMAGAAIVLPTLQFRKFWSQGRFWVTVSLLAALQIPLVLAVRPLIERLRAVFLLEFVIIDGLFVIAAILFVCSRPSGNAS